MRSRYLRALAPEGNITLSGAAFRIGGCLGDPAGHSELWQTESYLANLTADPGALVYKNHSTSAPEALFPWEPRRSAAKVEWPPRGVHLRVHFVPRAAPAGVVVCVHFELYDDLPVLRKWVSVHHEGSGKVVVDSLFYEFLRAPNGAPERMTVQLEQANNPFPLDDQVALARIPWHSADRSATFQRHFLSSCTGRCAFAE